MALAADALTSEGSAVRLVAAWAFATAGVPWSGELREAALARMADGALREGFRWGSWSGHPFSDLAGELAERGSPAAAAELVSDALTRSAAPGTRKMALLAASHLADISRGAAWPPFSAALDEIRRCLRDQLLGEEATPSLIGLTGSWGPAAAAAVPDLLAVLPRHGYAVGRALADMPTLPR